jgi:putative antitoxin of VapBC-like toxin-antitoxin system
MKTSLDIPEKELKDVLRFTKAKTKRDAIVTAVREYNQRKRMAALVKYAGSSSTFMTLEDLMKMRQAQ